MEGVYLKLFPFHGNLFHFLSHQNSNRQHQPFYNNLLKLK